MRDAAAIRSDNGPPFASVGAGGLTKLSVWWLRLGIRVERIEPGKPQQNGRQERFHRTLKAETANPPAHGLRSQQRVFDVFRSEHNEQRPHEALGQDAFDHLSLVQALDATGVANRKLSRYAKRGSTFSPKVRIDSSTSSCGRRAAEREAHFGSRCLVRRPH